MVTDGETVIRRVVCVGEDGALMTPCGACREFLSLLSPENENAEFLVDAAGEKTVKLREFLPHPWNEEK